MVNNSVNLFEKGKVVLDPKDKDMITELEEYRVKSISSAGLPIYTDENEHAIDAMNLCLLIFAQKYDSLLKKVFSIKTAFIGSLDRRDGNVKDRINKEKDSLLLSIPIAGLKNKANIKDQGVVSIIAKANARSTRAVVYQRRKF